MADNVMRSYTASGNLYGALLDANKQRVGGYLDLGDAWPFTIEVKLEQKSRKTSRKGMRGQIIDSGARIDGVSGSVGIKNWVANNIAMLVSGQAVKKTAASGSVTDQEITLPADGSWVPLGQRNVSSVTIATKVEGTDMIYAEYVAAHAAEWTNIMTNLGFFWADAASAAKEPDWDSLDWSTLTQSK